MKSELNMYTASNHAIEIAVHILHLMSQIDDLTKRETTSEADQDRKICFIAYDVAQHLIIFY